MRIQAGATQAWPRVPLKDLVVRPVTYGVVKPGPEGSIPLIRATDLNGGSIDGDSLRTIGTEVDRTYARTKTEEHDLLVGLVGSPGAVALVPRSLVGANVNRAVGLVRLDRERCNPAFAYYFLRGPGRARLTMNVVGSVQQVINLADLANVQLDVPPRAVQDEVVHVLQAMDDKIESNRCLAALLEETAAALFHARFVDFVGMKDLVESEIGPIPRHWTVRPLSRLGRFINGGALTKKATGSGRLIIRIAEMKNGPGASTRYTDALVADDQVARPGDLLFAWSGSLGVSRWTLPEAVINQHIFKCVPLGDAPEWLLEQCLLDALPEFIRIAADKATTMGHIRRRDLDSPRWAVPPTEDLTEIDAVMAPLLRRRIGCLTESHLLAELRDTLLPKLVSGQIRVRQAEQMVESV